MSMPTDFSSQSQAAIRVENASVAFRLPHEELSGVKEYAIHWLQRRLRYRQFLALKNISMEVNLGEIFGIIGRNGAGKSTLLKLMARILKPTQGRVVVNGKTAPLLELGAGFHPELTGRENIFFNGALLGLSRREITSRIEDIIAFAEIGEFVDSPIRIYSTGMVARLGFAVATSARPDVLLIDEVLSVGDAQFQEKCIQHMRSFQEQGTTIVLVSHSMARVKEYCQRAVWLDGGEVVAEGDSASVVETYLNG